MWISSKSFNQKTNFDDLGSNNFYARFASSTTATTTTYTHDYTSGMHGWCYYFLIVTRKPKRSLLWASNRRKKLCVCADSVFSRLVSSLLIVFYCWRMKLCKIDKNTTALHAATERLCARVCLSYSRKKWNTSTYLSVGVSFQQCCLFSTSVFSLARCVYLSNVKHVVVAIFTVVFVEK